MKIAFVSSLYVPNVVGGAERVVQQLAEGFAARAHDVLVVTTAPDGDARRSVIAGVTVEYLPVTNLYRPFDPGASPARGMRKAIYHALDSFNPIMARRVVEVVERFGAELVNTHNVGGFSAAVLPALAGSKGRFLPVVHTLHDQYLLCPRTTMFRDGRNCESRCRSCSLYAVLRARSARAVRRVIGVSEYILAQHRRFGVFVGAPAAVVHNAVRRPESSATARQTPAVVRFGYLGQLRETKGVHLLVDAFLGAGPGLAAELHVAGRGEPAFVEPLQRRSADDARIHWHGYVDPRAFLSHIDVLVVPSLWNDTAPLVVQEALAAGVPVLGSRRGGIPEFLDEECGWLFEPMEGGQLTTRLRAIAAAPSVLVAMSAAARRRASGFTPDAMLANYEREFAAALG